VGRQKNFKGGRETLQSRIGTCAADKTIRRICLLGRQVFTSAVTLTALAAICTFTPAKAQWAYDWSADEYLLSYGNAGVATFKINYNLITYNGVPTQSFDVKLLNRGTVQATIDSVVYSADRKEAWVTATGIYFYQTYELVNGRWTLVDKQKEVVVLADVLGVRLRAAYVALQVLDAEDDTTVYDSGGFYPYLFYTLMK
jgi:hypothetical protein